MYFTGSLRYRTDFEADLWPETGDFYLGLNKVTYQFVLEMCQMKCSWVNAHDDI